jgi:transposase InsO family protein
LEELYNARILCLHGVPKKIVFDRGSQFTSRFWKSFHENMDMKLSFSSAYHLQTNSQTERTNQVLEDMLRACALKHGGSWDKSLPYAKFSYNNSYQASLNMSPFEALYDRSAGLLYIGIRLEKDSSLGLRLFKRQKNKSV